MSFFEHVTEAPDDSILGLNLKYRADNSANKVDLGVGAYRDETGAPWVLPVIRKAEEKILGDTSLTKEYLPIDGFAPFNFASRRVLFGEHLAEQLESLFVTAQTLSGTGSLRVGAEFIASNMGPAQKTIYISNPTWGNHNAIFTKAGLKVQSYRYLASNGTQLDLQGLLTDLDAVPAGSVILLHPCAHNPTGVDPTKEQWNQIVDLVQRKKLLPYFDSAYQGFATGDLDNDAYAIRLCAERKIELFASQSFAKNLGLYGERAGAFHVLTSSPTQARYVLSQLKIVIRPMYSNPPLHPARLVTAVLNNPESYEEWKGCLRTMSGRLIKMRHELHRKLIELKTPGNWDHIVTQVGMFSYTGLTEEQVNILVTKYHIYLLKNGRISLSGLNEKTVGYVAQAIHDAVTSTTSAL
eukprot:TRINITY_DN4324_c0_g1_i1.p1 TRINITY_DN4324_c0_g1~~TRINITY_DN4324_c0_g1_i1.p1  ORF type:complete len:410 (-),score=94.16 TRINITY_DN4324_c0_g1_i1:228-1457(-)